LLKVKVDIEVVYADVLLIPCESKDISAKLHPTNPVFIRAISKSAI